MCDLPREAQGGLVEGCRVFFGRSKPSTSRLSGYGLELFHNTIPSKIPNMMPSETTEGTNPVTRPASHWVEVAILHCRHICLCFSCAQITSSTWCGSLRGVRLQAQETPTPLKPRSMPCLFSVLEVKTNRAQCWTWGNEVPYNCII